MTLPRASDLAPDVDSQEARAWDAMRSGDTAAFEGLFRTHAPDLANFALSYVGSPDAAEEIVHALFCWIWDHRHALQTPRSVRAYLFTAVRNRSRNFIRDERTRGEFLARLDAGDRSAVIGTTPATDSRVVAHDLEVAIAAAIGELPPRCREAFTLVREQGLSYADAATVLGIAPKTVEVHMSRALKLLRTKLAVWLER